MVTPIQCRTYPTYGRYQDILSRSRWRLLRYHDPKVQRQWGQWGRKATLRGRYQDEKEAGDDHLLCPTPTTKEGGVESRLWLDARKCPEPRNWMKGSKNWETRRLKYNNFIHKSTNLIQDSGCTGFIKKLSLMTSSMFSISRCPL